MLNTLAIVFLILAAVTVLLEATNRHGDVSHFAGLAALVVATVMALKIVL